jgi:hypothetical protein
MKHFLLFCILLCFSATALAQYACGHAHKQHMGSSDPSINNNAKSDSVDILHYHLMLDLYDIANGDLKGAAQIHFAPRLANINSISLDLLKLNVDSVVYQGSTLSFTYNDTILKVNFNSALILGDTSSLVVYYNGTPQVDASGWGGFHRQSGYYYNLGVGFAADPHTYGRAWFPCFDNFVEKSTYSFDVLAQDPNRAFCNGLQIAYSVSGDTARSLFTLDQPIPTYLASVAVSTYELLEDTLNVSNGSLPIWLMAKAGDTTNMKGSFRNLKPVTRSFIKHYGPYYWDKIGYAATTIGAMEHATSIHYPVSTINGNLGSEDLMAHELAHHWWGNLITCKTDADMWINEGMAEYSSHLYAEQVYGQSRYFDIVADNAASVLKLAHSRDNGYKAIYGLDHEYTYGFHVYQKGAMVGHNLRAYLGYNNFDGIITSLMANNKYQNLSTAELQQQLEQLSGKNLSDFFDQWVYAPGFPQFGIDVLTSSSVSISQGLYQAPAFFNNVPLSVTFFSANGDTASQTFNYNGTSQSFPRAPLTFMPVFALCNYNGKLLSGTTTAEEVRKGNGFSNLTDVDLRINYSNLTDSVSIITQKHWAMPRGSTNGSVRLSTDRYWTIQGFDWNNADMEARFTYNRDDILQDDELVRNGEDSIALYYRADGIQSWHFYADQEKVKGNATDGKGYIEAKNLQKGEYVLANSRPDISLPEKEERKTFEVYPNPAKENVKVKRIEGFQQAALLKIQTLDGKTIKHIQLEETETLISLKGIASQQLLFVLGDQTQLIVFQ